MPACTRAAIDRAPFAGAEGSARHCLSWALFGAHVILCRMGTLVIAVNDTLIAIRCSQNGRYDSGWMLMVRPETEDLRDGRVTGNELAPAYGAWMEREAFAGCGAPDI